MITFPTINDQAYDEYTTRAALVQVNEAVGPGYGRLLCIPRIAL